jgi:hypothetical protein
MKFVGYVFLVLVICYLVFSEMMELIAGGRVPTQKFMVSTKSSLKSLPHGIREHSLQLYDMNFFYVHISHELDLRDFCSELVCELLSLATRFKTLTIQAIFRFKRRHKLDLACEFAVPNLCDVLVLIPIDLSGMITYGIDNHRFVDGLGVLFAPAKSVQLSGSDFLLVCAQQFKAWDF